ncbi:MAG: 6-bladed beta-propeller [Candidatus Omnitrophota bacterium]
MGMDLGAPYLKKIVFIIFLLNIFLIPGNAKKITVFERNYRAPELYVEDDYIYVYDRASQTIDIYSGRDYKYLTTFGRMGEGPGEFKFIKVFKIYPDFIYIFALDKIAYFSKKGVLWKEQRVLPNSGAYIPIKDNFVYQKIFEDKEENIDYILADSNFKTIKHIYSTHFPLLTGGNRTKRSRMLVMPLVQQTVYKNKIYIADTTRGFFFTVFDASGNKLHDINIPYKKIPIKSEEKQKYIDRWVGWYGKKRLNRIDFTFPDYFPAFNDFKIADDKIYAFTYVMNPVSAKIQDLYILSLDGKLLKKATIPYSIAQSYDIHKNKYYYIMDNEDTENWELHMEEIK